MREIASGPPFPVFSVDVVCPEGSHRGIRELIGRSGYPKLRIVRAVGAFVPEIPKSGIVPMRYGRASFDDEQLRHRWQVLFFESVFWVWTG